MSNVALLENKTELVIMHGDLSKLTSDEKLNYMNMVCSSLGLNPLTRPFDFIKFQGKEVMYARKDCTEQLRKIHGVSIALTSKEVIDGIYVVSARAKDKNGKEDESTGAVQIDNLRGLDKANAMMKAETKAKRRVTLSICGLGMLDESEIESIPVESEKSREAKPEPPDNVSSGEEKYFDLINAFAGIGITKQQILNFCDADTFTQIPKERVKDLRDAFKDIKSGKVKKTELFG
jgi:hypothetical protein